MEQPVIIKDGQDEVKKFEQWCFKQTVEIEHTKQNLEDERKKIAEEWKKIEEEKRSMEWDKRALLHRQESEDARIKQQKQLFDMKWKILEDELTKLAKEKQQLQRQKEFYSRVDDYQRSSQHYGSSGIIKGEMFFVGVSDESSLKRRYKELIKIYHPDNLAGDTGTIQEINREYDKLKQKLG